ncbi:hypothetical protein X797_007493 [Metarhizium robertsii]|uniref:Uncharacterized protein n=1 Tax=Metarhizium robertsii TaxID=568076 RepID=A0A014NCH2_9HYPO|nr:hypothetical protein X797_007493 [Metarhizium robertsii]
MKDFATMITLVAGLGLAIEFPRCRRIVEAVSANPLNLCETLLTDLEIDGTCHLILIWSFSLIRDIMLGSDIFDRLPRSAALLDRQIDGPSICRKPIPIFRPDLTHFMDSMRDQGTLACRKKPIKAHENSHPIAFGQ